MPKRLRELGFLIIVCFVFILRKNRLVVYQKDAIFGGKDKKGVSVRFGIFFWRIGIRDALVRVFRMDDVCLLSI